MSSTRGIGCDRARSGEAKLDRPSGASEQLALERGRGAPENAHAPGAARAPDRHVARVVAHPLFLLEARVVLLVDDDEPQRPYGREEGAAGADRDVDVARTKPAPHREPFAGRQPRVQHRDVVAEARAEAGDELRRERDLGDEQDRPQAPFARCGDPWR